MLKPHLGMSPPDRRGVALSPTGGSQRGECGVRNHESGTGARVGNRRGPRVRNQHTSSQEPRQRESGTGSAEVRNLVLSRELGASVKNLAREPSGTRAASVGSREDLQSETHPRLTSNWTYCRSTGRQPSRHQPARQPLS